MDWKKLLAYITGSVDQELLLPNEYLVTENRILRNQINGRLRLTDGERKTLGDLAKKLGKKALEEVANIVKPDTLLGWLSLLFIHPWVSHLIFPLTGRQHPRMISTFLRSLLSTFKTRRALGLENLCPRLRSPST